MTALRVGLGLGYPALAGEIEASIGADKKQPSKASGGRPGRGAK